MPVPLHDVMTYLLALSSVLSRLIGVYRNFLLASTFGAGILTDSYFAAFQIPDTLYRLFVYGAISASFVPLFLLERKHSPEKAWEFLSSVMNSFLLVVLFLSIGVWWYAEELTSFLYPHFSEEGLLQTTELLRIMMVSPLLFTFSSLLSGIQNAFRSFWGFALAPIVYNLGIILGITIFSKWYGIAGVAYGVVIGAFLHALIQLIPCFRLGFSWTPVIAFTRSFRELFVTAFPRIFTMAGAQIMFFVEGLIATALSLGDITILRFAQDLQAFPIGVIGISMAISSFSVLSHFVLDEKIPEMARYLSDKLDHLLLLLIPASFGLTILREPIIRLTLQGGDFGAENVLLTSQVLQYLCLGIVFSALIAFFSRVFFAFHDTKWPFAVIVLSVIFNIITALMYSKSIGVAGIALASSLSTLLAAFFLGLLLRLKHLRSWSFFSWANTSAFLLASLGMSFGLSTSLEIMTLSDSWVVLFVQTLLLIVLGVLFYFVLLLLLLRKKTFDLLRTLHH